MKPILRISVVVMCVVLGASALRLAAQGQRFDSNEKSRAKQMLATIKQSLQVNYYDPAFHGLDLNATFKKAEQKIDGATSLAVAYAAIAEALLEFNDSHTFFVPPDRPATYEYGLIWRMVGDKCLVMAVKPGSDAEKKGLKPGDTLLKIGDFGPTRSTIWKIEYVYRSLAPRSMLNLSVQSPGGAPRDVQIAAKITQKPPVKEYSLDFFEKTLLEESEEAVTSANRASQVGNVAVWQLSGFTFEPGEADKVFDAVVKGASTLVIDMRGNPGGYVATLQKIAARLFDREVTLATVKQRKSAKPMVSKPKKPVFTGKVVLIIDADSASAAEVLARAMQLEERGTVIGDQSAGAVMQGIVASDALESLEGFILFGASITNADLIMKDGKSLERVGVTPNEIVLASPADLAAGLDKVLARAVELAGGQLDAASAGKMFPIEWKK